MTAKAMAAIAQRGIPRDAEVADAAGLFGVAATSARPSTGATSLLGTTARPWVWGLAASGTTLVGFTLQREIVTIDPANGAATHVANGPVDWYGAAGR